MRRLLRWLLRLVALGAVLYGAIVFYVWWVSRLDQRRPADAIVVLGAAHYNGRPSEVLRARLDQAAALYAAGLAPVVVVTGGMAEGDRVSEATVSQRYLVGRGLPDSAVVVLPVGRNSRQSMASAAEWLQDRGLESVLLVSDPFHMARLVAEARGHDLVAWVSPTRTSPISLRPGTELQRIASEALKVPVVWFTHLTGGQEARARPPG
ncbi:MAG TPA: YdcF family protein [Gemmatimonadales bacterium]